MEKKKRISSKSANDLLRKVHQVEASLEKYRKHSSSSSSKSKGNSSVAVPRVPGELVQEESDWVCDDATLNDGNERDSPEPLTMTPPPPLPIPLPPPPAPDAGSSASAFIVAPVQETFNMEEASSPSNAEIQLLLDEEFGIYNLYSNSLHKDVVPIWTHILKNGLTKECKEDLLMQYLPPENCTNTSAPKLNLDIKAIMSETSVKKDIHSQGKQNQLSSALSALGLALNWAISSQDTIPQAQHVIQPLNDVAKLICDCHYRESQSRRYAIVKTLNKHTRNKVKDTKIDEYLFGSE